ncbi:SDR family NAD(P)-dependent oxidoreductase [Rhizobium leguminosarum]|uniref:SDR family NAD(P)-dependent oxidoreductase n=1 Tax=Rhizobium leguminosarum TaxID=384 RepID=UPI001D6C839A|nr:SDR family NAD(P)-dependent oxidoreductase [Rhizobium leguminosarum]MBP2443598.1 NAD(P)-dependent dehydrogenase (short-subunit alcohol dehydrogenase family) [Rhizobium leguminosarum]
MEPKGKIALVTGAGSGIGKAAALRLATEGARVAVLSRTADEVEKTRAEIKAAGGGSIAIEHDAEKCERFSDDIML